MDSYYQKSINAILASVEEVYGNILLADELALMRKIEGLDSDAQRLFYRLFLRKASWFRMARLEYKDIECIQTSAAVLRETGLCEVGSTAVGDYLDQLFLDELKDYCKRHRLTTSGMSKRQQFSDCIKDAKVQKQQKLSFGTGKLQMNRASNLLAQICQHAGQIVRLVPGLAEMLTRLTNLYFLAAGGTSADGEAGLGTAILTDLNRRRYPKYEIVRSEPIFPTRDHWDRYEEARELYTSLWETIGARKSDPALPLLEADEQLGVAELYHGDVEHRWEQELARDDHKERYFLRRLSAGWVYTKMLGLIADLYEKQKDFSAANSVYSRLLDQTQFCLGKRGQWWERLVLNCQSHLKARDLALSMCLRGLEDPSVRTASRLALKRRRAKLERDSEWEEYPIEERVIEGELRDTASSGRKLVFQIDEDTTGSVESLVLHYCKEEGGWSGMHTESLVFTTLFGIFFWDILFMPVPDVFQSRYQNSPLDLGSDNFYPEREAAIEKRLGAIEGEGGMRDLLVHHYNTHHGIGCTGVGWETYSLEVLWNVARAVGGPALAAIFRVFAEDYKNHCSGMPDLVLWRPLSGSEGKLEHMLVEVKSARDRLSDKQRHWAWIFGNARVRLVVFKVKHP